MLLEKLEESKGELRSWATHPTHGMGTTAMAALSATRHGCPLLVLMRLLPKASASAARALGSGSDDSVLCCASLSLSLMMSILEWAGVLKCHCHWEPFDSIIATMQSTGCLFLSSTFGFRLRGKYCIFETKYWSVLKLDVSDSFSEFCLLELQYLLYLRLKFSSSNMVRCKSHINRENSHDFSEFVCQIFGKAKQRQCTEPKLQR